MIAPRQTTSPIPQLEFLTGLKNLINSAKKLDKDAPKSLLHGLRIGKRHLPNGICHGYGLSYALRPGKVKQRKFDEDYRLIASFKNLNANEMRQWIEGNHKKACDLLKFADTLLYLQNIRASDKNYYPTAFSHAVKMEYEFAATVALAHVNLAAEMEQFLRKHILRSTADYTPDFLMISNGEHAVSVDIVRLPDGKIKYKLHDANGALLFKTFNLKTLAQKITECYKPFNRYFGDAVTFRIAVLSRKKDDEFESLLNEIKSSADQLPEEPERDRAVLLKNKSPRTVLKSLIKNFESGQSKVGFLNDLLHYQVRLDDRIISHIKSYLCKKPSMFEVYNDFKANLAYLPRNGYFWLHQAAMTHERYFFWFLLHQAKVDPNLTTTLQRQEIQDNYLRLFSSHPQNPMQPTIIGPGSDSRPLADNEEVEIRETCFELSNALMYAAQIDVEMVEMLRQHGANFNMRSGGRQNGKSLQDMVARGSEMESYMLSAGLIARRQDESLENATAGVNAVTRLLLFQPDQEAPQAEHLTRIYLANNPRAQELANRAQELANSLGIRLTKP